MARRWPRKLNAPQAAAGALRLDGISAWSPSCIKDAQVRGALLGREIRCGGRGLNAARAALEADPVDDIGQAGPAAKVAVRRQRLLGIHAFFPEA